jgi:hypothetical protein
MKSHPRAHISEDLVENIPTSNNAQASGSSTLSNDDIPSSRSATDDPPDELTRIRSLLRPAPVPGLDDWGIPPPSIEPCDTVIEVSFRACYNA